VTLSPHIDALLDLAACPADRLWRYPICRVMVRPVMRTPLTPNHVTALHTLLAVLAGAAITTGTPRALFAAGLLFEIRAVLDCFDGALARAKGACSPTGRALDQLGDAVGFMSLMAGGFACLSRAHGPATAGALVVATTLVAASCTAAWDLFRRRLASLVTRGYDAAAEERLALLRACAARPAAALQMSRLVQEFQWYVLGAHAAPRLRDEGASREGGAGPAVTPLGRAVQDAAARNDPELRALLLRVGFVGGDRSSRRGAARCSWSRPTHPTTRGAGRSRTGAGIARRGADGPGTLAPHSLRSAFAGRARDGTSDKCHATSCPSLMDCGWQ
jgi:phosphatidylglycerophosphate synthase